MLSIIIVSYNTSQLTLNCIKSIYDETNRIAFEVIVIDNDSKDDTIKRIEKEYPEVKIIQNNINLGFAAALNIGIKSAQGNIILSLNSDTIIIDNAIEKAYKYLLEHNEYHVLGCKLLNSDGSIQPSIKSLPNVINLFSETFLLYKLLPNSNIWGKYHMSFLKHDKIIEVEWIKGAFMMIKKDIFNCIGYFDENFFLYSEETDFFLRIREKGFKAVFFPESEVFHFEGSSSKPLDALKMIHRTKIYLYKKNYRKSYSTILVFLEYMRIISRIPLYFIVGIITLNKNQIKKSINFIRSLF